MTARRWIGALVALAVLSAACGGGGDDEADAPDPTEAATTQAPTTVPPTTAPAPTTTTEPGPTTTTEPPPPPLPEPMFEATAAPAGAGMACIGTREGLSCLDESGWTTWTSDTAPIRGWVRSLDFCDDGSLVVPVSAGVAVLRDGRWSEIPVDFSNSPPDHVACRGGLIAAAFFGDIGVFENGEWTSWESEAVLGTGTLLKTANDLEIGPDGSVWVVTSNSVARYLEGEWTFWEEGRGFEDRVRATAVAIDVDAEGAAVPHVYIDNQGVATLGEDGWTIAPPDEVGVDTFALGDDSLWFPLVNRGIGQLRDGIVTEYGIRDGLSTDRVEAIAIDDAGRIWAGTSYGLSILTPDGGRTYRTDNSGLVENLTSSVAVFGAGPGLPADDPQPWATFVGSVELDTGEPLNGLEVEICVENVGSRFSGNTPCSGQTYFASTTTDDAGRFEFEYVRGGTYVVAVMGDTGWLMVGGSTNDRLIVPAGETTDMGAIVITPPESDGSEEEDLGGDEDPGADPDTATEGDA